YFNLFDYNGDEFPDLIYTNGDNADFPPILKPYHGIRIFQNDGQNNFEEVFFYPLNGAYKAIPADFDQDGDMDIAAISFFPDFSNRKEEGFVFLDNQGALEFKTYSFPTVNKGRWIVMDAEDADGDGDLDIALGSLAFEAPGHNALVNQWASEGIPFLILENTINE
ncbi:MAG: VCBS repeat-containing protein, partial [Bacteroidota bacterium]